ncbi:hypothetical protein BDV28DRAFT_128324 [Aspergillus coremiiformis]|uniref:Uncharacterized protein n=1 Tax=Aspergillus coremiiformis TaxID=138285 RepID=A0A5N6ZDM8_9EURO|nr:hypothetical protein BDV28DRAFT_128324 [Aspergillus coremiiformis]
MTSSIQQSKNVQPMVPPDGGGAGPPDESHLQMNRTANPHTSVEDYSRVMLQYTHNRMASFADLGLDKGSPVPRSGRSSERSSDSARSMLRRGPAPTSPGVSYHDFAERSGRKSIRDAEKTPSF